jgi:putative ABC transport system permease protein
MLKFAIRNLMSRPMRSLLSLVGLTVAIMGMIGLFSVAGGLNEMVADTFGRIKGLVAMQPGAPVPLFSRLPASWGTDIARVAGVGIVSPEIWTRANVIEGKTIISPPRFLFGADLPTRLALKHGIYSEDIVAGRFLTESDHGTLNAVVSRPIAEEFHKGVGDKLNVGGYDLKIVGVYYSGSLLLDVAIILDIDEARRISRFGSDEVSAYYIEQTGEVSDAELTRRVQNAFKGREIRPWQPASSRESLTTGNILFDLLTRFLSLLPVPTGAAGGSLADANGLAKAGKPAAMPIEVRSATDWAARFQEFSADLDLFLTIMSAIGVTIAVLSIVNTMLMSVTERIIEFGILKANGWSRYDVMRLITSESAVLGLCGGISGSVVGRVGTAMINSIWPDRIHLVAGPGLLLFGAVFSTGLGVLGGLYPAIWAMRMMPMDAIRRG